MPDPSTHSGSPRAESRGDWTRPLRDRLAGLKLAPAREVEIIEELSTHLDDRYDELVAGGATPADARRLALADLRDEDLLARHLSPLRQAHVHEPPLPGAPRRRLIGDLWQDLRYAVRMLTRERGFAAAVILTLALGIGANTAVFSLVSATLLQRLPVRQPEQLVYVFSGPTGGSVFSYPGYVDLRDGTDLFDSFAAWGGITASLSADGETDLVAGAIVTGNFFDTLGVQAARGRALTIQDDVTPGAHPVVVVSHRLWRGRFGGRDDIVNHDITMNGRTFTIVGVMPPDFLGAQIGVVREFYVPMMMQAVMRPPRAGYSGEMNPDLLKVRGNTWLFTIGRLKPGQTAATVATALSTLQTNLDRANNPSAQAHRIMAVPVNDDMPGQRAQMLPVARLLLAVVAAVLLIGCANVANLLLSRATARRREIAIRLAIGASRWRLVRQLLTESVLLALAGGAAGLGLAWLVVSGFRATPPPAGALPVTVRFAIDTPVLLFTLALSVATGLLFGLAPALRASRPGLVPALKDDSLASDERTRRFSLKKTLVVVEVALSLMLLVGAGLFIRSVAALRSISPGLDVESLVSAPLNINLLRYTRDQGQTFFRDVVARMEALPGVESATVARIAPLTNGGRVVTFQLQNGSRNTDQFQSENGGMVANGQQSVYANVIGPRFFRTLGITLIKGRDFTNEDAATALPVVIVSDAFARKQFRAEDAVGQRLSLRGPQGPWIEIVGVVADSKYATLNEQPAPIVYLPLSQNHESGMVLFVRATRDPETLSRSVRQVIQTLEPNLPVPPVQPMTEIVETSIYPARMGAGLLTVFGALALLLASVGIYGVLAFFVSQRTREMGIRAALGASRRDVFGLILREGLTLIVIGAVIGVTGAAFGVKWMSTLLYGVETRDAVTFVIAPVVLVIVGMVACLLPARRAMRVDPTVALKSS